MTINEMAMTCKMWNNGVIGWMFNGGVQVAIDTYEKDNACKIDMVFNRNGEIVSCTDTNGNKIL